MASGSTNVVIAAMIANAGIAVLKFFGFLLTGSPSMLAETYHSISDTGNQVLLLVGIRYSNRTSTRLHPFGYGKAQFFYAFLVSVLLFGIAGWESFTHGVSEFQAGGHPEAVESIGVFGMSFNFTVGFDPFWVNVAVLLGGIVFESYAFKKAHAELRRQSSVFGWDGYREVFRQTSDVTTLTAFTEDTIALIGLVFALIGIILARVTGNPLFDAVSAVLIGILLMVFAVALAIENKRLIIGESLPEETVRALRDAAGDHDGVTNVDDIRTMFIGAGKVLVAAEISFESALTTEQIDEVIHEIEQSLIEVDSRVQIVYIEPEL